MTPRENFILNPREQTWQLYEPGRGRTGPFTYTELKLRYEAHEINGDTRCWRASIFIVIADSKPLKTVFPEFKSGDEWPIAAAPRQVKADAGVASHGAVNLTETISAQLERLIAIQEEQTRLLIKIRWGIFGIGIFIVSQFLKNMLTERS